MSKEESQQRGGSGANSKMRSQLERIFRGQKNAEEIVAQTERKPGKRLNVGSMVDLVKLKELKEQRERMRQVNHYNSQIVNPKQYKLRLKQEEISRLKQERN